jgi:DNA-binding HxlR family transcriptional regulator
MDTRYGIFCPVAKAAEIVAGRWTPLILSELMKGSERFGDIQAGVPLMSRSLLARRLKQMEQANLIVRVPVGKSHVYRLTEAGNALRPLINQFAEWGSRWRLPYIDGGERNVSYLMRSLREFLLGRTELPEHITIQFEFRNVPKHDHKLRTWWLIKREDEIDLCFTDMGFESDLVIEADLDIITRVVVGVNSMRQARSSGDITFTGSAKLVNAFIAALGLVEPPQIRHMRVPTSPPNIAIPTAEAVKTKSQAA